MALKMILSGNHLLSNDYLIPFGARIIWKELYHEIFNILNIFNISSYDWGNLMELLIFMARIHLISLKHRFIIWVFLCIELMIM